VTQLSYRAASETLDKLLNLVVPSKQVERITKGIGQERCDEREEAVAGYLELPLVERKAAPAGVTPPAVGVVGTDGGRLQILDEGALTARGRAVQAGLTRQAAAAGRAREAAPVAGAAARGDPAVAAAPPGVRPATALAAPAAAAGVPEGSAATGAAATRAESAVTATAAAARGPDDEDSGRFWREDKIGLLMAMTSAPTVTDPCPDIPETFVDATRMRQLVRALGKGVPVTEEAAGPAPAPAVEVEAWQPPTPVWQPPQVQEKRLLATRQSWEAFGPMVAAAAWAMGLFAADRRAFLSDGAEANWTVWRCFFSSFEPILDFIHALSYVHAAAHAGRSQTDGWKCYVTWIRWVWQGQVGHVLAALAERQVELGLPEDTDGDSHPRKVVDRARTYLSNNQGRMHYDRYRRLGLPITSSYVESAVKQFNQRVKGTEKFWGEAGAEALLQLRGDHLSDNQPLEAFWERRQAQATGQRHYRQRRKQRVA
jgi:hypothetical protein